VKVGIIQSNYLPWRGYFDFIDEVDLFIFYDDVQYTHRDWRNRNLIKTKDGLCWISVPVIHDRNTLVNTAKIDYSQRWAEKQIKTISLAYNKAEYFKLYSDNLFELMLGKYESISDLNIQLIKYLMKSLGISTHTRLSSEFNIEGNKYERPLNILKHIGADSYLSGPAARPYTDSKKYFEAGIQLQFKSYDYSPYQQLWGTYEPNLSIIDLLFNCGPESYSLIKSRIKNETVTNNSLVMVS